MIWKGGIMADNNQPNIPKITAEGGADDADFYSADSDDVKSETPVENIVEKESTATVAEKETVPEKEETPKESELETKVAEPETKTKHEFDKDRQKDQIKHAESMRLEKQRHAESLRTIELLTKQLDDYKTVKPSDDSELDLEEISEDNAYEVLQNLQRELKELKRDSTRDKQLLQQHQENILAQEQDLGYKTHIDGLCREYGADLKNGALERSVETAKELGYDLSSQANSPDYRTTCLILSKCFAEEKALAAIEKTANLPDGRVVVDDGRRGNSVGKAENFDGTLDEVMNDLLRRAREDDGMDYSMNVL